MRGLLPGAVARLDAELAADRQVEVRNPGLDVAKRRVARDGWTPLTYCVRCGARNPEYSQLCGFASWHITRSWPGTERPQDAPTRKAVA